MAKAITEHWDIAYLHAPGTINGTFFAALKQGKLLQRGCACCHRRSVPPCPCWDAPGSGWREARDKAALIASVPLDGAPDARLGLMRLEETDTLLVQRIRGATQDISRGAPLRLAFAAEPQGRMDDFWFVPDAPSTR